MTTATTALPTTSTNIYCITYFVVVAYWRCSKHIYFSDDSIGKCAFVLNVTVCIQKPIVRSVLCLQTIISNGISMKQMHILESTWYFLNLYFYTASVLHHVPNGKRNVWLLTSCVVF